MLTVRIFSAFFPFNTFADFFFLKVNLPDLMSYRWRVNFHKYFCPLWQGKSYSCVECVTPTELQLCTVRDTDGVTLVYSA